MRGLICILKKLFGKKPAPVTGNITLPVMFIEEPRCIICGGSDYEQEMPQKGRCVRCRFPRGPVIIQTQHGNKVVPEEIIPHLERMQEKPKRKGVMF